MLVCFGLNALSAAAVAQTLTPALPSPSLGLIAVNTPYLRIEWPAALLVRLVQDQGDTPPKVLAAKACANLGEALLVGKGAWGLGLFSDFGCYLTANAGDELLAGHQAQGDSRWVLRLSLAGDALQMETFYAPPGEPELRVSGVTLPASIYVQDLLREKRYASLAAALALDALPAVRRFDALSDTKGSLDRPLWTGKKAPPRPKTLQPKALLLYTWSYQPDKRLWMPHIVGSAKIVGSVRKSRWHLTLNEPPGNQPLYAQSPEGSKTHTDQILGLLSKREKDLLTKPKTSGFAEVREGVADAARFILLNTIDTGYIGVRIGRELIDASSPIPPATVIGVLGEIRGGYLSGLRVYFDYEPRHGRTINGQTLWIEWSRVVAGYNFGLSLPWLVDRLEAAPKIGVWNVDSRLPAYDDQGNVAYQTFVLNEALSLGFELGAVWEGQKYLLRLWYARDLSVPFVSSTALANDVLSSRYGIDAFLKGPPISLFGKSWWLSYLFFAYHEDLTFTQEAHGASTFSLETSSNFAGGGLSLAW